jgi:Domain of unknown function (DUF309)
MTERLTVTDADGRAKAYRPLPAATRAEAVREGLEAYERGDFFEAHELLEPAWMGTDDAAERAFLQGLIKLAAAYVHDVRGNPAGIAKNLEGARARLVEAGRGSEGRGSPGRGSPGRGSAAGRDGAGGRGSTVRDGPGPGGVDRGKLIVDIDVRLADLATHPGGPTLGPPTLHRSPA